MDPGRIAVNMAALGNVEDCPVALILLAKLAPILEAETRRFNAEDLSLMLRGLRNMLSSRREVVRMLGIIADKLEQLDFDLPRRDFCFALSGLASMEATAEVRRVVKALLARAERPLILNAPGIAGAMTSVANKIGRAHV